VVNAADVLRAAGESRWRKCFAVLIAIACLAFVWFVFLLRLITPGLNY
jgi:lipopolysaccharide export LptBFGC system permease protein LptF